MRLGHLFGHMFWFVIASGITGLILGWWYRSTQLDTYYKEQENRRS